MMRDSIYFPPVKDGSPVFKKLLFRYRFISCLKRGEGLFPSAARERWDELEQAWLKASSPQDAPGGFLRHFFIPMLHASIILGDLGLGRKTREWAQEYGQFPESDLPRWHALNHILMLGEEKASLAAQHLNRLFELAGAQADESIRKPALEVLGTHAELFSERPTYSFAETLCRKSLELAENTYGGDHPEVTASLHGLAGFLCGGHRRPEAVPLFHRIVANDEKNLGPEHPTTARSLDTLAISLEHGGQPAEAEPLRRRVLAIHEKSSGENSEMAAYAMRNLGLLLQKLNQMPEAEGLLRRALGIHEKNGKPRDYGIPIALSDLGLFLLAEKRHSEAEPLLRRVVVISRDILHPVHAGLARALKDLALMLQADQRPDEAEPLAREAVEIYLADSKPQDPGRQSAERTYREILADLKLSETEIVAKMRSLKPRRRAPSVCNEKPEKS